MACTTETPSRRGALLIVVAGLLAILVALTTTFFLRVRNEASRSLLVEQAAQARLMLNAALQYLQEASRIGYGDPLNPSQHYGRARIGAPDPLIDPSKGSSTTNRYWSYPDGFTDPSRIPAAGDHWRPPTPIDGINGDYTASSGAPLVPTERSWVGWYTPVHRGLAKDYWSQTEWENAEQSNKPSIDPDTLQKLFDDGKFSATEKYRDVAAGIYLGSANYEARFRSQPIPLSGASSNWNIFDKNHPAPADWQDGSSAPWNSGAWASTYRIRAELVDDWPVGGPPKLFPMHVRQESPFAVLPVSALVSTYHLQKSGSPAYFGNVPHQYPANVDTSIWAAADAPMPPFQNEFPGFKRTDPLTGALVTATSWYPARPDPALLHPQDDLRWRGLGTVVRYDPGTGTMVDTGIPQSMPRQDSLNLGWFRIYRETPDTFIITAGAGASQGYSLKADGSIERNRDPANPLAPFDVISPTPCPFASPEELRLVLANEVRLWFRVTWHPGVGVKRGVPTSMGCAQGGTFTMIQRLHERELGPPSLKPYANGTYPLIDERLRLRSMPVNAGAPESVCPSW